MAKATIYVLKQFFLKMGVSLLLILLQLLLTYKATDIRGPKGEAQSTLLTSVYVCSQRQPFGV